MRFRALTASEAVSPTFTNRKSLPLESISESSSGKSFAQLGAETETVSSDVEEDEEFMEEDGEEGAETSEDASEGDSSSQDSKENDEKSEG